MVETLVVPLISGMFAVAVAYLSYALSRHVNLGIAEKRLAKYSTLWAHMKITSRMDHELKRRDSLSLEEREHLYAVMTDWYFDEQGGFFLTARTRNVFVAVKKNLVCPASEFQPTCQQEKVVDDDARSTILVRQFSLMRTRMKADLAIYGTPSIGGLDNNDRAFLHAVHEEPDRPPWSPRF